MIAVVRKGKREDPIERLHREAFGFVPEKRGTAYERLAAVVLAVLGWRDVVHDVIERREGRLATHQLDVVASSPDGSPLRLVVECKHYRKTIGQAIVNQFVGVCGQIGAEAGALVTTVGFTAGARAVAADNDVALLQLRPYDDARDRHRFIWSIDVELNHFVAVHSAIEMQVWPGSAIDKLERSGGLTQTADTSAVIEDDAGQPLETLRDVFARNAAPLAEGSFQGSTDLPRGRWLRLPAGRIEIARLSWIETNHKATRRIRREAEGEPVLIIEKATEDGDASGGRMLVDRDLVAWTVDTAGRVRERGKLGHGEHRR